MTPLHWWTPPFERDPPAGSRRILIAVPDLDSDVMKRKRGLAVVGIAIATILLLRRRLGGRSSED
jgi:hypothetical protein